MQKSFSQHLREYRPLVLVLLAILILDFGYQSYTGGIDGITSMRLFMALFFIAFGLFKLLDLDGFAMAYAEYDILAKRSKAYAYVYPFIELALGVLYFFNLYPVQTNIATVVVMGIGSIGVIQAVTSKRKIHCACLGAVVKLPMTTVTIIEDLGMVVMAFIMLAL